MGEVFFVNDTSSGLNWGSHATSAALRALITDMGWEIADTRYKIQLREFEPNSHLQPTAYAPTVVRNAVDSLREFDPVGVYRSLRNTTDVVPQRSHQFESYATSALENGVYQSVIQTIRSVEAVVINAEGLLYKSADRCTRSLFFIAYLATEHLETPCLLTNVTFDPSDPAVLEMAEHVFPKVDEVVFREPVSAAKYADLCAQSSVAADPVFSLTHAVDHDELTDAVRRQRLDIRPYSTTGFDPTDPYITVAGNSIYADRSTYPTEAYKELCRVLKEICPQVLLVVSARADEQLLTPVADALDLDIVSLNVSIRDSLGLLSNASVYVGGRYHPTIFSLKGGVPVVPFAPNTHKMAGLLELLDVQADIFDPFEIGRHSEQIAEQAAAHIDDSAESTPPTAVDELSETARKNVEYLETL